MLRNRATVKAMENEEDKMRKNSFISVCFKWIKLNNGSFTDRNVFQGI